MSQARTGAWWRQARNDLKLAELARRNGFHAQAPHQASCSMPATPTRP
jgi:hypothetical protein